MNTQKFNQQKVALARWRSFVPAMTGAMAMLGLAACAEKPVTAISKLDGQTPSGTVEMHQVQVAFIGSGDAGSGVLHYKGHDYPLDVGGLGFGGFGVSTISAEGAVYHLADAKQLGGVYGQGRYGIAAGDLKRGGGDL